MNPTKKLFICVTICATILGFMAGLLAALILVSVFAALAGGRHLTQGGILTRGGFLGNIWSQNPGGGNLTGAQIATLAVSSLLGTVLFFLLTSIISTWGIVDGVRPLNEVMKELNYTPGEDYETALELKVGLEAVADAEQDKEYVSVAWAMKFLNLQSPSAIDSAIRDELILLLESAHPDDGNYLQNGNPIRTMRKYVGLADRTDTSIKKVILRLGRSPEEVLFSLCDSKEGREKYGILFASAPEKKRVMIAYLGYLQKAANRERRLFNLLYGPIQFLTIWMFFFGLGIVGVWIGRVGLPGRAGLEKWSPGRSYGFANFCRSAIPSLGFVGTVWGISQALGNADGVVKAMNIAERGEAVQAVTGLLGVAFDTTLVALVCGIILLLTMIPYKAP